MELKKKYIKLSKILTKVKQCYIRQYEILLLYAKLIVIIIIASFHWK